MSRQFLESILRRLKPGQVITIQYDGNTYEIKRKDRI